ncbi:hypothetical protein C922_05855, partial [Plasmodium inui San Antonio 1]
YNFGKSSKNKNVKTVLNVRNSRLLRGYEQTENNDEYENLKQKLMDLVDEDDKVFTSHLKSCMRDDKFREQFNLLMNYDDDITSEYKPIIGDKTHKNSHPNLEYTVNFNMGKRKNSSLNKYDSQDFTSDYDSKKVKEYGNPNQNRRKRKNPYKKEGGHDYNYDDDDYHKDYDEEYDKDYDKNYGKDYKKESKKDYVDDYD